MHSLRSNLIRLAHSNRHIRSHLLPLLTQKEGVPSIRTALRDYPNGMSEREWHDWFLEEWGSKALGILSNIDWEATQHYRPKDDPSTFSAPWNYKPMYDRILNGAKRYGVPEDAAKAFAKAKGYNPEKLRPNWWV